MVLPGGTSALGLPERRETLHETAGSDSWAREAEDLAAWLIGPARLSGDAAAVTSGFAQRLTAMGIPLHRLRIAMRVDNPLLTAWGILWTPETAAEIFTLSRALLDTPTYVGSPAQHVIETGTWFRPASGAQCRFRS
jgi:adenylate cyclase